MRRLFRGIKHFFLPPPGSSVWLRILPFVVLGVLTVFVLSGSSYAWTYTNSPEFCGSACHTMPPNYSTYLQSPHARVQCVECHIGRDVITTQFTRKAGDLRHVYYTITQDFEYPIHSEAMRPARDSCERCHFPEKFSDDSLRVIRDYEGEDNSLLTTHLLMKTGGGSQREGLGRGIHWHIENEVWYLAEDQLEQDIPYVRVVDEDGQISEFYDIESGITPDDVAGKSLELMDCINCHNRVTHTVPSPEDAIDLAFTSGQLSRDLPAIYDAAYERLSQIYTDSQAAEESFDSVVDFYAEGYPDIYSERQEEIEAIPAVLADLYSQMVFGDQRVDWKTHPDNLGHVNSPGCFRCHDGKHLSGTGEAIRLECNLCHSVPIISDETTLVTNLELVRGPEPPSHIHSSWIALHGKAIDSSCAACHEPADPEMDYTALEGRPPNDGSFCGNAACHGPDWEYAGFDSPALEPFLERQLYILQNTSPYLLEGVPRTYDSTFKALFDGRCVFCHGPEETKADLDLSSYEGIMQGGKSGPVIVPGDPENSALIAVQSASQEHFGQVLDDELVALREWLLAGAPEE